MTYIAIALGVLGFGITVWGAVLTYRGRIRPVEGEPGLNHMPEGGGWNLVLTITGAVVALAGLIVGLVSV